MKIDVEPLIDILNEIGGEISFHRCDTAKCTAAAAQEVLERVLLNSC